MLALLLNWPLKLVMADELTEQGSVNEGALNTAEQLYKNNW